MPQWFYKQFCPDSVEELRKQLRISPLLAHLLSNRDLNTVASAREFLEPSLDKMHQPSFFQQMEKAVQRIFQAVQRQELIVVYGDYDVDGITGASLLYNYFCFLKTPAMYYSPDRITEGYGLNLKAIETFLQQHAKVLITVDCGTSNLKEVAFAQEQGLDVLITDHHESPPLLPPAYAILNPKLADSGYPFPHLCGAGVAFKLCWALSQKMCNNTKVSPEFRRLLLESLSLVAIGTVADVVPLVGENRIFVHFGLKSFAIGKKAEQMVFQGAKGHKGLQALIEEVRLDKNNLNEIDIGFRLAPLMNAAGRISRAMLGIELLTSTHDEKAKKLAKELAHNNRERQELEKKALEEADKLFLADPQRHTKFGIVLANPHWHPGVIGIVAARIAERYHRPTLIVTLKEGIAKGSGRSIGQIHLYQVLSQLKENLIQFGGHAAAVGFSLKEQHLPWLEKAFDETLKKIVSTSDLVRQLAIDKEILLSEVDTRLMKDLERLSPFGQGNPVPLFSTTNLKVAGTPQRLGKQGAHLRFYVSHYQISHQAIAFDMGERQELLQGKSVSLVYTPKWNTFQTPKQIQLEVKDLKILND